MAQQPVEFELTKEFRDQFQQAIDEKDESFIQRSLEDAKPADISTLLYEFDAAEGKYVLDLLPIEVQSEVLNDLDPDIRKRNLAVYPPRTIAGFLNQLQSDDTADA